LEWQTGHVYTYDALLNGCTQPFNFIWQKKFFI